MSLKVASKEDVSNWAKRTIYHFDVDGMRIMLKQLGARDLEKLLKESKQAGNTLSRPRLIVMSAVNEEGNRIFGDDDLDYVEREFSLQALRKIGECIESRNGIGEMALEEQEKNSMATLS